MRVISGTCKGRPLLAVPGKGTRPTVDKVKESIFNMIGPYFQGGIALDLYAGTGGLGIEALSRGIEKVIFVDIDRKAIEVIKQNIQSTGLDEKAEIYKNDSHRALKALVKRGMKFDLVFLDPPYARQKIEAELAVFYDHQLLSPNACIVVESDASVELAERVGRIEKIKETEYGNTKITVYQLRDEREEGAERL